MTRQEEIERHRRRQRIIRARARKRKMRRRAFFFLGLAIIVIIILIILLRSFFSRPSEGSDDSVFLGGHLISDQQKNNLQERPRSTNDLVNFQRNIIHDNIDISLVKGSNHSDKAESYAFSAKEIREYILGEKEYAGNQKWAFITFDDGPSHEATLEILNVLKKEKVPATFFVVGKAVSENTRDILLRQIAEGHGIALHSYSHDYHYMYPERSGNPEAIVNEIEKSQQALQNVLNENFHSGVWRYPGGHMSWNNLDESDQRMETLGVEWIDWNCLCGDAERKSVRPTTVQGQVDYMNKTLKLNKNTDIAVVLCHDAKNKQLTIEALPSLIASLRDQGYNFGILK